MKVTEIDFGKLFNGDLELDIFCTQIQGASRVKIMMDVQTPSKVIDKFLPV